MKVLFVSFLLLFSVTAFSQTEPEPVQFSPIAENLYLVKGGRGANSGIFIGQDAVVLIDIKMTKQHVDETLDAIKNLTDKPVKYLINTHSDGDHVNGNRYVLPSVTIIAHENCRNDFFLPDRNGNPSEWQSPELYPFIPGVTFQDNLTIHTGQQSIELYYFGVGHTTGDIVVYFPESKIAFMGDQVFADRPQLIHSHKNGNSFEHVKTLQNMLKTLDAEQFYSGHSDVLNRTDIETHITAMKQKQSKIKNMINEQKSLSEIKNEFDNKEERLIESIFNEIHKM